MPFCNTNAYKRQLYNQCHKTAHRALQWRFLRLHPLNRRKYKTGKSGYNAACATLERITAPGLPTAYTKIPPPRRTLYRPAQPPYYNKVYKGARVRPYYIDPCQTVQHIADHASPAGSAPAVCGSLASAAPAEGSAPPPAQGQPGTIHPAGQSSGRGTAGGAEPLAATAVSLFGLSPDSQ